MPAQSATFAVLSSTAATVDDLHIDAADCSRLLEVLSLVPDPRKRRGVRHSIAALLAIVAAAVLAGARSVLVIGEWAGQAPQVVLAARGARYNPTISRFSAPHGDTFRRVLRRVDADALDAAIGLFLAERAGLGAAGLPPPGEAGGPAQAPPRPPGLPRGRRPAQQAAHTRAQHAGHAGTVGGRQDRTRGPLA